MMVGSKILGKIDFNETLLKRELEIINTFPILDEEYSEFGVGTWKNHTLWNHNGDYNETQYSDYDHRAKITPLGEQLNYINQVISDNFKISNLKMVRSRNLIDGIVIPHRDFIELVRDKESYIRVFIPLENNYESYHSDEYGVFQMRKGEIWQLDASIVHAAVNFSRNSRLCLCLDFQLEGEVSVDNIFKNKFIINKELKFHIPERKTDINIDEILAEHAHALSVNNIQQPLFSLSKLHYIYDVSINDCYDWLIKMAKMKNNSDLIDKCEKLKHYMIVHRDLGERFNL